MVSRALRYIATYMKLRDLKDGYIISVHNMLLMKNLILFLKKLKLFSLKYN